MDYRFYIKSYFISLYSAVWSYTINMGIGRCGIQNTLHKISMGKGCGGDDGMGNRDRGRSMKEWIPELNCDKEQTIAMIC